jgi:hypothetical protein
VSALAADHLTNAEAIAAAVIAVACLAAVGFIAWLALR